MILLDATVMIAYLDADDVHHDRSEALLLGAVDDGEEMRMNPVTLAEVLVAPTLRGRLDDALGTIRDVGISELPFPDETAVPLARLRAVRRLKMPDCCVLLAATVSHSTVATFDRQLRRAAREEHLRVLPDLEPEDERPVMRNE